MEASTTPVEYSMEPLENPVGMYGRNGSKHGNSHGREWKKWKLQILPCKLPSIFLPWKFPSVEASSTSIEWSTGVDEAFVEAAEGSTEVGGCSVEGSVDLPRGSSLTKRPVESSVFVDASGTPLLPLAFRFRKIPI